MEAPEIDPLSLPVGFTCDGEEEAVDNVVSLGFTVREMEPVPGGDMENEPEAVTPALMVP